MSAVDLCSTLVPAVARCYLKRGATQNIILGASAFTDGSLSEAVILTEAAVGEGEETIGDLNGRLDVTDTKYMAERLGATSLDNFVRVIRESVEVGGAGLSDVRFLGITHMKRSFYLEILQAVGLTPEQSVYLEDYGHVQSVDQVLALELGSGGGQNPTGRSGGAGGRRYGLHLERDCVAVGNDIPHKSCILLMKIICRKTDDTGI